MSWPAYIQVTKEHIGVTLALLRDHSRASHMGQKVIPRTPHMDQKVIPRSPHMDQKVISITPHMGQHTLHKSFYIQVLSSVIELVISYKLYIINS